MPDWENYVLKEFQTLDAKDSVSKALPILKKEKQVVVFDKGKYLGVATRKNLLKTGLNMPEEQIGTFAYKPPYITSQLDDLTLAKYFIESGLHYMPVFEEQDKNTIVEIIHRTDFLANVVTPILSQQKVEEIATTNPKTINSKETLAKAVSMFQEYGISKLVVFDDDLKGVITLSSILTYFLHATQMAQFNLKNTFVKEVMKNDILTIDKSANVSELVKLFKDKHVSSVVVLDNKELFGIITKTDLLENYVYLLEQQQKKHTIQIAAKFPGLYRADVELKLSVLEKMVPNAKVFAYFKMGKEKFRGQPLINCRVRIVSPKHNFNVSVEGWGVEHATELAVKKLKRQLGEVEF